MATNRDIRIPIEAVHGLRRSLLREMGAEAAGRALQEAGYAVGDTLFQRLSRTAGDDELASTPSASFWDRLNALFRELGWGTLTHEEPHPGVGALVARDWFEVDPDRPGDHCPVTTGALANLLGRVAEDDVAVLQVRCEGEEPGCCRFIFGSTDVLEGLYAGLREGRDLQAALGALE